MRPKQALALGARVDLAARPEADMAAGEVGMPRATRREATSRRALLGAAGAGAVLTAACGAGGSAGQDAAPRAPVDRNQKDELTWLVWSSDTSTRKEAYDAMAKRFNEQFPNITVQRIAGGNENLEKLITMFASDTRVDVIGTRPDYMASYVTGPNPFRNLREFMRRDSGTVKEADHADGVLDGLSFKGTLYALPVGVYTNNLCLNLDILAQQGVPVPKPTWTIDEAMEIARRTTVRRSEEDITWGFFQQWEVITHFPYSWIRGNGGEPLTPNEDVTTSRWATDTETLKTMQWLVDLGQKAGVTPVTGTGGTSGLFTQGKVAINVNETNNLYGIVTSQQAGSAQFKWTMHPLPRMARGTYQPINAFAYGVSRNTKNPDVAWELLKQMVGPAGQTDWYKLARFAPSIKSLLQGPYLQDPEPPTNKQVIVDAILASKAMPKSARWVDINKVIVEVLAGLRAGKVSVNAGLADIDRRVAAIVSQK